MTQCTAVQIVNCFLIVNWTEGNIYYLKKFCPGTFYSNGRISETKRDFLDPLVPTFSSHFGLFHESDVAQLFHPLAASFRKETSISECSGGAITIRGHFDQKPAPETLLGGQKNLVVHPLIVVCTHKVWAPVFRPLLVPCLWQFFIEYKPLLGHLIVIIFHHLSTIVSIRISSKNIVWP